MFDMIVGNPESQDVLAASREALPAAPLELIRTGVNIFQNQMAQPLVCGATLARWVALRAHLPRPMVVLGYSVGELAAHAIAGTFGIPECLQLAAKRAALMDKASPAGSGLMAIVGLNERLINAVCAAQGVSIAIANGESHFVLGGSASGLEGAQREVTSLGARAIPLKVGAPAHTPWLERAAEAFARELANVKLRDPAIPLLAGIDGHVIRSAGDAASALAAQIARTIQWRECLVQAMELGARVFLELGPGSALSRMLRESFPDCIVRSVDEFKSLTGAISWVRRAAEEA
jgi:[acyl-carrier-protein] S-malonyltransferase